MVIQQDSVDSEYYVLNDIDFAKNYKLPGEEITGDGCKSVGNTYMHIYGRTAWAADFALWWELNLDPPPPLGQGWCKVSLPPPGRKVNHACSI